ncbi:MAG TPA: hypothetical protein VEJ38_10090 [Candidatus Acidoferrales bacterium]|nr:hypothetical protein [Candidatus Acidoferrales bacterium]
MGLATVALLLHLAVAAPSDADVNAKPAAEQSSTQDPFAAPTKPQPAATVASDSTDSPTLTAAKYESSSQNSQSLSTIRVPPVQPGTQSKVIMVENSPSRRKWLVLSIAMHSAAAFDAYSTRQAVSSGAHETDPLMRPFASSPGIYAAIQAGPLALDYAARRMQRSQNSFLRRTWWLPQTASTGLFIFSGVHNLNLANRP